MVLHNEASQEISDSGTIDKNQLCCPHCGFVLRLVVVSADMASTHRVSSSETGSIIASAPAETIEAVSESVGDTLLLEAIEKTTILKAMRRTGNDRKRAARMLGIGKTTLYRKLKDYGFGSPSTVVSTEVACTGQTLRTSPNPPGETTGTVIKSTNNNNPLEAIEKTTILTAMQETENDRQLVAQMLGMGRTTLYRRLKEYGVPRSRRPRSNASRKD